MKLLPKSSIQSFYALFKFINHKNAVKPFNYFQVEKYQKHFAENLTDRRVLKTFVDLVYDLDDLRQRLVKMTKRQDEKLEYIYTRWSKMLSLTMVQCKNI